MLVFPHHSLVRFIIQRHRAVLAAALLLTVLSAGLISRLQIDFSLDSMLPTGDPRTRQLLADLEDAGTQDVLIVLVSLARSDQFDAGKQIVDELVRQVATVPSIGRIEAGISSSQRTFVAEILLPHAFAFLPESGRDDLRERLSDTAIERQVQENRRFIMMPMQGGAEELLLKDPLNLRTLWLDRWLKEQTFGNLRVTDGYLADDQRRHLLVFIHPRETARNLPFTRLLMAAAGKAADASLQTWQLAHPGDPDPPTVSFAGGYPIALEDEALTRKDLQITLLVSLVGVNLLFFLVFRNVRVLVLVLLPLAMGIAWTFGAMRLIFGHVSVLTGAFGGVLLGISTDFAIYFLNFFLDLYRREGCEAALMHAMEKSGRGIVTGGVTSATGFLTLGIASFTGFRELGVITGLGLLFCLTSTLFVLPSLLIWSDRRRKSSWQVRSVAGFGLERVFGIGLRFPRAVVTGGILTLLCFAVLSFSASFDDDMRSLRPRGSSHFIAQKEVESILGGAGASVLVTMEGRDVPALLDRAVRLNEALERLREDGRIAHFRSILSYLPAPATQRQAAEYLETHSRALDLNRIEATFRRALQENGFAFLPEYEPYLQWLGTLLRPTASLDFSSFERAGLEAMLDRFLVRKGDLVKLLTTVHPAKGLWTGPDLDGLRQELAGATAASGLEAGEWRLGGFPVLSYELKRHVWNDLTRTVFLACAAVGIFVGLSLGGFIPALLASTPVAAGLVTMLGGMTLLGMQLNFANFIVLPVMIGICVNDGVLIMNTRMVEPGAELSLVLGKISRAVLLTSLTTLMGFGSLVFSHYPGLRSIGWLSGLGILAELSASLLLLPAILAWTERMHRPPGEPAKKTCDGKRVL